MKLRLALSIVVALLAQCQALGASAGSRAQCVEEFLELQGRQSGSHVSPRPDGKIYSVIRKAPPGFKGDWFVSLSEVQKAMSGDLGKIWPPIDPSAKLFFDKTWSPFNWAAGSLGPLSKYGANGNNIWNPSFWVSYSSRNPFIEAWLNSVRQYWKNFWKETGMGPMSSMSQSGATGKIPYEQVLPMMGPYGKSMQEGGVLSFFGPKSAMGPDGPLGELSGEGTHLHAADPTTGEFVNGRRVVTRIRKSDGEKIRTYDLDPTLAPGEAQRLSQANQLHASFVTDETMDASGDLELNIDIRKGTVPEFRVISDSTSDRFAIDVLSKDGTLLSTSDSRDFATNIIQMSAARNTSVRVRIRYLGSAPGPGSPSGRGFRFIATEAPAADHDLGFDGPYLTFFQ